MLNVILVLVMNASEIIDLGSKSRLLKDPYVEKVWQLVNNNSLFNKSPDYLASLRLGLLRDALGFFSRQSDYYAQLFERLSINPKNAELGDLARLAVPSDILRGDGHKQFLIKGVEERGEYFTSSGTSGKEPVRIYRSPLDLAIMIKANTQLFEHIYGSCLEPGKGIALFMAAPELRYKLSFVAFVHLALENKGIPLIYGMDLVKDERGSAWQKLEPNRDNMLKFLKSKEEPKLFFTAPVGVYLMAKSFDEMSFVKKVGYKLVSGTPPVKLGRGGAIVTGGGTKGYTLPPYEKIVELSRKYFTAKDKDGEENIVPFMDVLGMAETLTALIGRFKTNGMVPYPLSEVFLLDPKTYEPLGEGKTEGVLGIFNPFVTTWLEVFYPGDLMTVASSKSFYGKEFSYVRRLTVEEGWDLQRACGGSLEEMMQKDQV
jgi:phenylacetate-CoA ligase